MIYLYAFKIRHAQARSLDGLITMVDNAEPVCIRGCVGRFDRNGAACVSCSRADDGCADSARHGWCERPLTGPSRLGAVECSSNLGAAASRWARLRVHVWCVFVFVRARMRVGAAVRALSVLCVFACC
jgi:hypothetical protein